MVLTLEGEAYRDIVDTPRSKETGILKQPTNRPLKAKSKRP
jgi:hypothetical protein